MIEKIYSVQEIATRYGVDEVTVRRRIFEKKLKAFRTNGKTGPYRVTQEALDEFEQNSMLEVAEQGA